jgi:hypothetical protein
MNMKAILLTVVMVGSIAHARISHGPQNQIDCTEVASLLANPTEISTDGGCDETLDKGIQRCEIWASKQGKLYFYTYLQTASTLMVCQKQPVVQH